MRKLAMLVSVATILVFSSPVRAQFCPGVSPWVFDDVQPSDPFCGFVTWMAQNGVSLGCQIIDGNHRLYCPAGNVSRLQMAAFMNRTATQPDSTSATVGTITKPGGAFLHNFGTDNTFLGVGSGNFAMTGAHNTAIGKLALPANTTGFSNTALGYTALANNTTGANNTAGGTGALGFNTIGNNNTGFGQSTLNHNTTGGNNSAFGNAALVNNTVGHFNTGIGIATLAASINASNNTAVGSNALLNSTADANTAVGSAALLNLATGSNNIAIGVNAGSAVVTGSGNVHIGHFGDPLDNATIRVGFAQTRTFIVGVRGAATGVDAVNVVIDGNGQLGTISSSRNTKEDIADMSDASAALMRLRPVTFHYKADRNPAGQRLQYGLVAEEVAEVYPGLVARGKDGAPETVMYQYLAPMLLNEFQRQQRTIDAQRDEIAQLRKAVELLLSRMAGEGRVAAR